MPVHQPVLLREALDALLGERSDGEGQWVLDCTFGGGGHTAALIGAGFRVLAIDRDPRAVEKGRLRFAEDLAAGRLLLAHARFGDIASVALAALSGSHSLVERGASPGGRGTNDGRAAQDGRARPVLDEPCLASEAGTVPLGGLGQRARLGSAPLPLAGALADLGFSSDQLADSTIALSFGSDSPLDLRLDRAGETGAELLARIGERELESAIRELGGERFARRIARAVVAARDRSALPATAAGLAALVARAVPAAHRHGRIHVATRTFQALRMLVNDELGELDRLLSAAPVFLPPGARLAVISFHSGEDARVKRAFRGNPAWREITRKPLIASDAEIAANPRARSAKLRVAEREA